MKKNETGEDKGKEVSRCAYCGNPIRSYKMHHGSKRWEPSSAYCGRCRYEGLDNVHMITGKSNGWEKRLKMKGVFGAA